MEKQLTKARPVWFGILSSILVFVLVAVLTPPTRDDPGQLQYILPTIGVFIALSQPMIGRLLAPRTEFLQWLVIRMALAEGTALFGFVPALLGGSYAVFGIMTFLALMTMAFLTPTEALYDRWRELHSED